MLLSVGLTEADAQQAGITVITHGLSPSKITSGNALDKNKQLPWMLEMAVAIGENAKSRGFTYSIRMYDERSFHFSPHHPLLCDELLMGADVALERDAGGTCNAHDTAADEVILLYPWIEASNENATGMSSAEAAALANALVLGYYRGEYNISQPMHFIGHSRGTVVNSQAVRRLLNYDVGANIDHVTFLDPHDWGYLCGWDDFDLNGDIGLGDRAYPPRSYANRQDERNRGVIAWRGNTYYDTYYQINNLKRGVQSDLITTQDQGTAGCLSSTALDLIKRAGLAYVSGRRPSLAVLSYLQREGFTYALNGRPVQATVNHDWTHEEYKEKEKGRSRNLPMSHIGVVHRYIASISDASIPDGYRHSRLGGGSGRKQPQNGPRADWRFGSSEIGPQWVENGSFEYGYENVSVTSWIPGWGRHFSQGLVTANVRNGEIWLRTDVRSALTSDLVYVPQTATELTFDIRTPPYSDVDVAVEFQVFEGSGRFDYSSFVPASGYGANVNPSGGVGGLTRINNIDVSGLQGKVVRIRISVAKGVLPVTVVLDNVRILTGTPTLPTPSTAEVVYIIDSSGSMRQNDPRNARTASVQVAARLLPGNTSLAVVDFDTQVQTIVPPTLSQGAEEVIQQAMRRVNAEGGTDIGRALAGATGVMAPGIGRVVLLTDGQGSYNDEALAYRQNGWCIDTVGLGSDVNSALLSRISADSGCGTYRHASRAFELTGAFAEWGVKDGRSTMLARTEAMVAAGTTEVMEFTADGTVSDVSLLVSSEVGINRIQVQDANGSPIETWSPQRAEIDQRSLALSGSGAYRVLVEMITGSSGTGRFLGRVLAVSSIRTELSIAGQVVRPRMALPMNFRFSGEARMPDVLDVTTQIYRDGVNVQEAASRQLRVRSQQLSTSVQLPDEEGIYDVVMHIQGAAPEFNDFKRIVPLTVTVSRNAEIGFPVVEVVRGDEILVSDADMFGLHVGQPVVFRRSDGRIVGEGIVRGRVGPLARVFLARRMTRIDVGMTVDFDTNYFSGR
ncbi:MAG: vWA domain-containing protein [Rhodothermales bacterium]